MPGSSEAQIPTLPRARQRQVERRRVRIVELTKQAGELVREAFDSGRNRVRGLQPGETRLKPG
jgi:hypothetical protein